MTNMLTASTDAYVRCIWSKYQETSSQVLHVCEYDANGVGQEACPVEWGVKGST